MLRITEITTATRPWDGWTPVGERPSVTAAMFGDVELCNAVECLDATPERMQVSICGCGHTGCEHGGWVTVRRCGSDVLWVPSWDAMERGDAMAMAPPDFLCGVAAFDEGAWGQMRRLRPDLPAVAALPPLHSKEAVRVVQAAAPLGVLGEFPDQPRLRRDVLLGVVAGELARECDAVDRCLQGFFGAARTMKWVAPGELTDIEFLLDSLDEPTWSDVAWCGDQLALVVDDGAALVVE